MSHSLFHVCICIVYVLRLKWWLIIINGTRCYTINMVAINVHACYMINKTLDLFEYLIDWTCIPDKVLNKWEYCCDRSACCTLDFHSNNEMLENGFSISTSCRKGNEVGNCRCHPQPSAHQPGLMVDSATASIEIDVCFWHGTSNKPQR